MKTRYILGALAVAAALLVSCKKDDQDPLAGLKNNQVSWNGKIGDITGGAGWTGGVFCSDWSCKSLNIAQALDLGGDALNGSTIDLAQLKGVKEGFRISMMDPNGTIGFHLEAGGGPGESDASYTMDINDPYLKDGSCFTEGKFTGKYDEKANSFHVEYWGTLVNGNTIAVKFDVPKCGGGGHAW